MEWGTVPQWITAISSTAVLGLIGTLVVGWWRRGIDLKKLTAADEADIRDHYAEELGRVVTRQHECEEREQKLRDRVRKLETEVEGLYRTLIVSSADRVLGLGDSVPAHFRDLAERTLAASRNDK